MVMLIRGPSVGTDDQTSSEVIHTPSGDIEASELKSAIEELDTEKMKRITSGDNEIVRFDGSGGDVQRCGSGAPTVSDGGEIAVPGGFDASTIILIANALGYNPNKTYTISSSGGDYTTVQAALDANTNGGELFLLYPGTYVDDTIVFTANNQCVAGTGLTFQQLITSADANILDFSIYVGCRTQNIRLNVTAATSAVDTITGSTGSVFLRDTHVSMTNSDVTSIDQPSCVEVTGSGSVTMTRGKIDYNNLVDDGDGATAIKAAIRTNTGSTVTLKRTVVDVDGAGQSLAILPFYSASTGIFDVNRCEITVDDLETSQGIGCYFLSSGTNLFSFNNIHVTVGNGIAYGIYTEGTVEVDAAANHIHVVDSGGTSHSFFAGSGTTINSTLNSIIADDGYTGTGTVNFVHTSGVGNFDLSGKLTINQTNISGIDNQAFDILVSEALESQEHWTGLRIKPDALDPGGADTRIRCIALNLSGVDTTNVPESMECIRLVVPSGLTGPARAAVDAIRILEGDINQTVTIPATAAETFTLYDMSADISSLHANSEVHGLNITTAGGVPAGSVVAVGTHTYVEPIHQHIGTYTTPSQTEFAGRKTGGGVTWADGIDAQEIFVANADEVYIGGAAQFSEIEVIMGTPGTKTVTPTFWYSTAADSWTQFFPEDATSGFIQNGLIHWTLGDISGLWTGDGDPGAGDSTAGYWIKIIRTAAPDPGTATPTTMKIGIVTVYKWDQHGDLDIRGIKVAGTIELNKQAILIDVALAADHSWTGPTQTITAGENLAIFETAYLKSDGKYWKIDASAEATAKGKIVMATAAINADATGIALLPDSMSFIRDDSTSEWTVTNIGEEMYLSTTGGELTNDVSGYASPDILRVAGYMETATILNFVASKAFVRAA